MALLGHDGALGHKWPLSAAMHGPGRITCASVLGIEIASTSPFGCPEFDNVGAIVLRGIDHDPILAGHDRSQIDSRLRCSRVSPNIFTAEGDCRGGRLLHCSLIASCSAKTVSKTVHAPPADGPCRNARRVCVGVNLTSADRTRRVPDVLVCAYALVANRARRSAIAVTVSADVLATDPTCRVAVSIGVGVYGATAVNAGRIPRSIRLHDGALGVQWKN